MLEKCVSVHVCGLPKIEYSEIKGFSNFMIQQRVKGEGTLHCSVYHFIRISRPASERILYNKKHCVLLFVRFL